jgi:hypothetical protein
MFSKYSVIFKHRFSLHIVMITGYVGFRNTGLGSNFGLVLAQEIVKHAHCLELHDIFSEV